MALTFLGFAMLCLYSVVQVLAQTVGDDVVYLPMIVKSQPPLPGIIVFSSDRSGNYEIYTMMPDGTNLVNISNNVSKDYYPTWSPDGKKIAFVSDRDGNLEIYTMNADGSDVFRLTNHSADDNSPEWSHDGSKIAFRSFRDATGPNPDNYEIYVTNPDGTEVVRLTNNSQNDYWPTWSPDGTQIAYCSDYPDPAGLYGYGIFIMNHDGTGRYFLTRGCAPDWSPDGQRIAYEWGGSNLKIIGVDGTEISNFSIGSIEQPDWSPDGEYLAFVSWHYEQLSYDIHIIAADGTGNTNLTNHPAQDGTHSWGIIGNP